MDIPCPNGETYLFRRRVFQCPWLGVYLHDIRHPDEDSCPHGHPWSFVSVILRGHYVERYYPDPEWDPQHFVLRRWRRFSWHRMNRSSAHRIVEASPGLKTLILVGPRSPAGWGFYVGGDYVRWQDYEHGIHITDEARTSATS